MAEKIFRVDEVIELVYQAPNKESNLAGGLAPVAEIYLPSDIKDSNFPDVALVEIGSSGIYKGIFIPDQQGEWKVVIHKSDGDGQVVKRYSVGAHNVDSVGQVVSGINTVVSDIDNDITVLDSKVVNLDEDVVALDVKVVELDTKAEQTHTKLDNVVTKIDAIDTPPMVS